MGKEREKNKTVRCQVCHYPFEVHREDAKYCSPTCRQLAYRIRQGRSNVILSKKPWLQQYL